MCIDAACAVQACVDGRLCLLCLQSVRIRYEVWGIGTYGAMQRSVHVLAETRRMSAACDGHVRYAEKGKQVYLLTVSETNAMGRDSSSAGRYVGLARARAGGQCC